MFLGHWQFFKDFFQVAFLRYLLSWFAIVPVFVKLLWDLPERLQIPGTDYILTLSLPFTWWLLWLASLSYFLSFILFHAFCPQFIKRYPSFSEYKSHSHSPRWIIWEFYYAVEGQRAPKNTVSALWSKLFYAISPITQTDKLFQRVITKQFAIEVPAIPEENPQVERDQTSAYFKFQNKDYKIACNPSDENIAVKENEIFWEVFGHFAKQGPGIRWVISTLIAITIFLLLVVLGQHVWSVISLVCS